MRKDFAKLLCERPRTNAYYKKRTLRVSAAYHHSSYREVEEDEYQLYPIEAIKTKEPVKYKRGGTKLLNENLGPLIKFLRSNVGRKWDDVYSEICQNIPKKGTVNLHVYQHLFRYIHKFSRAKDGRIYRTLLDGSGPYYSDTRSYYGIKETDIFLDKDGIMISASEYKQLTKDIRDLEWELSKLNNLYKEHLSGFSYDIISDDSIETYTLRYGKERLHLPYVEKSVYVRIPVECFDITSEEVYKSEGKYIIDPETKRSKYVNIELPPEKHITYPKFDNKFIDKEGFGYNVLTWTKLYNRVSVTFAGKSDDRLYPKEKKIKVKHSSFLYPFKVTNPVICYDTGRLLQKEDIEKVKEKFWEKYNKLSSEILKLKQELDAFFTRVLHE